MMKFVAIFVTCFLAFASCDEGISTHVVGGVDAHILDHPYMAKVHVFWRNEVWWPFCGSAIINRRSLLTVSLLKNILNIAIIFSH